MFDEDKDDENYYHHVVQLMDVNKKEVFYDKLTYIYLEMPKFCKTEEELSDMTDKWLYALKNLSRLLERPKALQERIFRKFFEVAEVAALSKEEYAKYWESEKVFYDNQGAFMTADYKGYTRGVMEGRAQGEAKGRAEERLANARSLMANGILMDVIIKSLGLTPKEIEQLSK